MNCNLTTLVSALSLTALLFGCNHVDEPGPETDDGLKHAAITGAGTDFWLFSGLAIDLAMSLNKTQFAIGYDGAGIADHSIWKCENNGNWIRWPGGGAGVRIAVDPQDNPWVVNSSHNIYSWNGLKWVKMPGKATDIGIGGDGSVFITSYQYPPPSPEGNYIYKWNGSIGAWMPYPGAAMKITVDLRGNPTVVNASGMIWKWNGSSWVQLPGTASDITANQSDDVALAKISRNGVGIQRWDGSYWTETTCGEYCFANAITMGNFSHTVNSISFADQHYNIYQSY